MIFTGVAFIAADKTLDKITAVPTTDNIYVFAGIPAAVIVDPITTFALAALKVIEFVFIKPVAVKALTAASEILLDGIISSRILQYSIVILQVSEFLPKVAILFE